MSELETIKQEINKSAKKIEFYKKRLEELVFKFREICGHQDIIAYGDTFIDFDRPASDNGSSEVRKFGCKICYLIEESIKSLYPESICAKDDFDEIRKIDRKKADSWVRVNIWDFEKWERSIPYYFRTDPANKSKRQ